MPALSALRNLPKSLLRRQTLVVIVLAGFALSLALILHYKLEGLVQVQSNPTPLIVAAPIVVPGPEKIDAGVPVRLKIPKTSVDAAIDPMGVTPEGAMEVPKGPANVGWFKFGSHPGDNGSAVIAGHYGRWKNGGGSVFDDLNKLVKGDQVAVEDEKGATTIFVVRESRTYQPTDNAADVFTSNDGKAHLNLITCQGAWNNTQRTFSTRLIVFTDKQTEL